MRSASPPSVALQSRGLATLQRYPRIDPSLGYCSLRGAEAAHAPGFGRTAQWDVPLLDGYSWVQGRNRGDGGESFWGLWNPSTRRLVAR